MTDPCKTLLLIAHPGHELLLYGWIRAVRPIVCALTDGSGFAEVSRLQHTRELLRSLGAAAGPVFGEFTDRELYAALLERRTGVFASVVRMLAELIAAQRITTIVVDAMEGYNPIHDLCRTIAGTAAEEAGVTVRHFEYPIEAGPHGYSASDPRVVVHHLDDATLHEKIATARRLAPVIPDIQKMLADFGEDSFREEPLRAIDDWTAVGWSGDRPGYEILGEQRVAAGRYRHVIRWSEHVAPLLADLRKHSTQPTPCAS